MSLALNFLGNASAAISHERQRRAGGFFNEDLKPLIEEEDRFKQAAPCLFGKDFLSISKDHTESVKALDKLSAPHRQSRAGGSHFFRTGRPLLEGAAHTVEAAATTAEEADTGHMQHKRRTKDQTEERTSNNSSSQGIRST